MASWLKKTSNRIELYHTSELPYPITDNEVWLCDNNMMTEHLDETDNYLGFSVKRNMVKRQSANYWRLKQFPYRISRKNIITLSNNEQNREDQETETIRVAAVKCSYVHRLSNQSMVNLANNYDKSFLLFKTASSDDRIRMASSILDEQIAYGSCWHLAILNMLNKLCLSSSRSTNWIQNIPDLTIELYGIKNGKELGRVYRAIDDFNINDKVDLIVK